MVYVMKITSPPNDWRGLYKYMYIQIRERVHGRVYLNRNLFLIKSMDTKISDCKQRRIFKNDRPWHVFALFLIHEISPDVP